MAPENPVTAESPGARMPTGAGCATALNTVANETYPTVTEDGRFVTVGCDLVFTSVIDQDRFLIPRPGRRCAELMALELTATLRLPRERRRGAMP